MINLLYKHAIVDNGIRQHIREGLYEGRIALSTTNMDPTVNKRTLQVLNFCIENLIVEIYPVNGQFN
jgi:hypothetical protein